MSITEILPQIHTLQHVDKLRLIQTLLQEIAAEEGIDLMQPQHKSHISQFSKEAAKPPRPLSEWVAGLSGIARPRTDEALHEEYLNYLETKYR
ncbi:MAG: hypothetical protein GY862_15040 [Gammaproteobacteria bacterium]|nr:hypothetical protein [Gammaproteobacteria bacterium]